MCTPDMLPLLSAHDKIAFFLHAIMRHLLPSFLFFFWSNTGPNAVITNSVKTYGFREFAILIGDFAPVFDRFGQPLNFPEVPGGDNDIGKE